MNLWVFSRDIKYFINVQKMFLLNALNYKADLIAATLGSYGFTALTIVFLNVIYSGFSSFYGWNYNEMLIIFCCGQFCLYLIYIFVPGSVSYIGRSITSGELDKHMLKPVKTTLSIFTADSEIINMLPAIFLQFFIFFYAISKINNDISIFSMVAFVYTLTISFGLLVMTSFCLNCISFFAPYMHEGFLSAMGEINQIQKYPAEIYSKYLYPLFMFFIPVGLISYVPAKTLIKGIDINLILLQLGSFIFLLIVSIFVWKRGLKNYTSVSG